MALTFYQQDLIKAVLEGNREMARKRTYEILNKALETKQDGAFAKHMLDKYPDANDKEIKVPYNLSNLLTVAYPSDADYPFNINRYFLSERESAVAGTIEKMYHASQQLKERKIKYSNTVLLDGKSGTGKTEFGKYIAYRLGLPFVYLNFTNVIDSLLGKTGQNIDLVFSFVQKYPCVFMIDEIDSIGEMRSSRSSSSEKENGRIVTTLFLCLDKLSNDNIVIGATNRKDILDSALISRFRIQHTVETLRQKEREQLVAMYLRDTGFMTVKNEETLAREISEFAAEPREPRILESQLIQRMADSLLANKPIRLVDEKEPQHKKTLLDAVASGFCG